MGTSIKLFGTSRIKDGKVSAYVAPVMISKNNPLYSVNDVFNGIVVKGNMLGTSMFYGSGAGKLPTASAVVADIIEAVQNIDKMFHLAGLMKTGDPSYGSDQVPLLYPCCRLLQKQRAGVK